MLHSYSILRLEQPALNLFEELKRKKIRISIQMFTSMIRCYYKSGSIDKAWQLYSERYIYLNQEDDMLINTMLNICSSTHDAEKAKNLWDKLLKKGKLFIKINLY